MAEGVDSGSTNVAALDRQPRVGEELPEVDWSTAWWRGASGVALERAAICSAS